MDYNDLENGFKSILPVDKIHLSEKIRRLDIHAEEMFCCDTYEEGNDCNTDTDDCHFKEPGLERFILRYRSVVSEHGDDDYHDGQHDEQSQPFSISFTAKVNPKILARNLYLKIFAFSGFISIPV